MKASTLIEILTQNQNFDVMINIDGELKCVDTVQMLNAGDDDIESDMLVLKHLNIKTSEEWQKESDIIVYDPDGWDRKNYQYSWFEELITKEEYDKRVCYSTCIHNIKSKT